MKKIAILTGAALTLAIAAIAQTSLAGPKHHGEHRMHGADHGSAGKNMQRGQRRMNMKRAMHHLSHLDLSEQQKIDIKAAIKDGMQAAQTKRETIAPLRQQMRDLGKADVIDESAIKALSLEIANVKSDLMILHLAKKRQIGELLTEEQRAKLAEMKADHRKHRRFADEEDIE
jgi:Spy/CpxP family protein refolding chaperone